MNVLRYATTVPRLTLLLTSLLLALACSGCGIATFLNLQNNTGGPVIVKSGHTGQVFEIKSGATAVIPHTAGPIDVTLPNSNLWHYSDIDIPEYREARVFRKKYFRMSTLDVTATLNRDGTLVIASTNKSQIGRTIKPESKSK